MNLQRGFRSRSTAKKDQILTDLDMTQAWGKIFGY